MSDSGIVDAYFWCQLLGWNFDIGSVILLEAISFLIVIGVIVIIALISVLLDS